MWNNTVHFALADQHGFRTHPQERATNPYGFFLGFSSSATPDEIAAAYMYLEWMAQPDVLDYFQWGAEGVTYNYVDGARVMVAIEDQGDMWMGFSNNKDYWAVVVEMRVSDDPLTTAVNIIPGNLPESDRLRAEQADRYSYLRVRADHGLTYNDPLIGTAIPALGEHRGALSALFQQLATQLVKVNPDNFNEMYEEHVATYRAAGYAEIEEQRGAAFDNGFVTRLNPIARGDDAFNWWSIGSVVSNVYD
jgi:putative aldouronate transport system substrate-binding protein